VNFKARLAALEEAEAAEERQFAFREPPPEPTPEEVAECRQQLEALGVTTDDELARGVVRAKIDPGAFAAYLEDMRQVEGGGDGW
jgi:hypothetical protein